jgi:hypothetical protein
LYLPCSIQSTLKTRLRKCRGWQGGRDTLQEPNQYPLPDSFGSNLESLLAQFHPQCLHLSSYGRPRNPHPRPSPCCLYILLSSLATPAASTPASTTTGTPGTPTATSNAPRHNLLCRPPHQGNPASSLPPPERQHHRYFQLLR